MAHQSQRFYRTKHNRVDIARPHLVLQVKVRPRLQQRLDCHRVTSTGGLHESGLAVLTITTQRITCTNARTFRNCAVCRPLTLHCRLGSAPAPTSACTVAVLLPAQDAFRSAVSPTCSHRVNTWVTPGPTAPQPLQYQTAHKEAWLSLQGQHKTATDI
jgi:hypothetical protein